MSVFDRMSPKQKALFLIVLFACGVVEGYLLSEAAFEKQRYETIQIQIKNVTETLQADPSVCKNVIVINQTEIKKLKGEENGK